MICAIVHLNRISFFSLVLRGVGERGWKHQSKARYVHQTDEFPRVRRTSSKRGSKSRNKTYIFEVTNYMINQIYDFQLLIKRELLLHDAESLLPEEKG